MTKAKPPSAAPALAAVPQQEQTPILAAPAAPISVEVLQETYPDPLQHKILVIQGKHPIVLRRPTQDEVIEYEDRISILTETAEGPSNLMDDGDKQIIACIVYPDAIGFMKLYKRIAALPTSLRRYWSKLAGSEKVREEDDSAIPQEVLDNPKNKGKELIAFRLMPMSVSIPDDVLAKMRQEALEKELNPDHVVSEEVKRLRQENSKIIVCSRFEPLQIKMFQAKSKKSIGKFRVNRKELVAIMEANLVHPDKTTLRAWGDECPYLRYDLAQLLFAAANAEVDEYEGK